jgi:hypothetical protein
MDTRKNKDLAVIGDGTKPEQAQPSTQVRPNYHKIPCVSVPMMFAATASAFFVRLSETFKVSVDFRATCASSAAILASNSSTEGEALPLGALRSSGGISIGSDLVLDWSIAMIIS